MTHYSFYASMIYIIVSALFGLTLVLLAWAAYRWYFARTRAAMLIRPRFSAQYHAFIENQYTRHGALITFILCGIVGAMVDVDHIPELLLSLVGVSIWGRMFHSTFLILGCLGCAYYGYLLYQDLKRHKDAEGLY